LGGGEAVAGVVCGHPSGNGLGRIPRFPGGQGHCETLVELLTQDFYLTEEPVKAGVP